VETLSGNPVSPGIALGEIMLYQPCSPRVGQIYDPAGAEEYTRAYEEVVKVAALELQALSERLDMEDPEKASFFTAQQEILSDIVMAREIRAGINNGGLQPDEAIDGVYSKYAQMMSDLPDPILKERAADIQDVRNRLLRICAGDKEKDLANLAAPCIVAAKELLPSDTVLMDREKVLAIVTETGGETSHCAIIARSYGIPALMGVTGATAALRNGQYVIVDAIAGVLLADPDSRTAREYAQKKREREKEERLIRECLASDPTTADGERVSVMLNIEVADTHGLSLAPYVDGVGLFRTEFLYLGCQNPPSEERQAEIYTKVLSTFGERPVIIRTLDVGGDKPFSYLPLPDEANPFLGVRGLRLCFSRPELFHIQLRAALRASVQGNLWLMFPMVTNMEDIRKAKESVEKARQELIGQSIPVGDVKLGIMVEVPSIALISDRVAEEVDFASIGTNDLCQYLTAADRLNPSVSDYYEIYHPAVFRVIRQVILEFDKRNKPVSICGEMGGDPVAVAALIGLGMRKFSMSAEAVAGVKKTICALRTDDAREFAEHILTLSTAEEVSGYLRQKLAAPDSRIRKGS